MEKFALSIVNYSYSESDASAPVAASQSPTLEEVVIASLRSALSKLPDQYQPVQTQRVQSPNAVLEIMEKSQAVLLLAEVAHIDHVTDLAHLMRLLKQEILCGQLRMMIHFKIQASTLVEKLRLGGRTEIVHNLESKNQIEIRARSFVEFLLLQSEARGPLRKAPSSLEMALKMSQWMSQTSMDPAAFVHIFSAFLSTICGGNRFEFMRKEGSAWRCLGTSDGKASLYLGFMKQPEAKQGDKKNLKIHWVGSSQALAWVCEEEKPLSAEQSRSLQAALELSDEFGVSGMPRDSSQPDTVLSTSGLNH